MKGTPSPEFYVARAALLEVAPHLADLITERPCKLHPGLSAPRHVDHTAVTSAERLVIGQAFLLAHKVHDRHAHYGSADGEFGFAICCRCCTIPGADEPTHRSWCWHH